MTKERTVSNFNGLASFNRCIDESEISYVSIYTLKQGEEGTVLDITVPSKPEIYKMSIEGKKSKLAIRLADKDNNDINWNTKVKIIKEHNKKDELIDEVPYSYINTQEIINNEIDNKEFEEFYTFNKSFTISNEDHLKIYIINPDKDIEITRLMLDIKISIY